jgi:membrane associated rhomboid family serine protease
VLAVAVFAVTAAVSLAGLLSPHLLHLLERTPAGLHGQWWRTLTSLLVQDSWGGALFNLAFLLILGVLAEQVTSRQRWLAAYIGAGLAGELAGYAWQPTGAGDSVAICGLAAIVAIAAWRGRRPVPVIAALAVAAWCGGLLSTWWYPLIALGIAACVAIPRLSRAGWPALGAAVAGAVLATGAALAVARNIHGVALLAGLLIALAYSQVS